MSLVQALSSRFSGRSRAVGIFFVTSLGARFVGIACQLLQVPLVVRALGPEAFGLWMTLTGIGALILFSDFGVGQGAQNKLTEAFAAGRHDEAKRLWGSTLIFFAVVCAVLLGVIAVLARAVDFPRLFNLLDPDVRGSAPGAVLVALSLYCLNFPLGLAQRLAYAQQRGWMHNLSLAATGAGSLGGTWLATHLHWKLPGLIAAAQIPLLAGNAMLLGLLLRQLGWLRFQALTWDGATMKELLKLGAYFGVQQIQLTVLLSLPAMIISTSLGAVAVTPYNLAQRLFNLFAVVQNAFMLPLWPAYGEAKARGEFSWIRRTLYRSLGATLLVTVAPMALGAAFARPVLGWWIGNSADLPDLALVWLLFAWNALTFLQQPFGYLLAGISEVKRATFFAVISTVFCVGLMTLWVDRYQQAGVVLGMIAGYMPFFIFGNLVEIRRVFRLLPRQDAAPSLAPAAAPAGRS